MAVASNQSPFTERLSLSPITGLLHSFYTASSGSMTVRIINYFDYFPLTVNLGKNWWQCEVRVITSL